MSYRRFSPELDEIAEAWAAEACTKDKWRVLGPFGATESSPFRVSRDDDGLEGLAKPGVKKSDAIARAAHEKIASDLAYHLGLPVPPVILWDRGEDCESERYVSVSAWAFSPALSWQEVQGQLTHAHKSQAAPIVSAVLAFETWISAEDRKSDHVLAKCCGNGQPPLARLHRLRILNDIRVERPACAAWRSADLCASRTRQSCDQGNR